MAKIKVRKQKKREDYSAAFVVGTVVGGLAGALAVLWTTPKTGQQMREQIAGAMPAMPSLGGSSSLDFGTTPKSGTTTTWTSGTGTVTTSTATASATTERPADVKAPGEATGEPPATGLGHVASTEELVTPPTPEEQVEIRANAEAILNEQRPS